MLLFLLRYLFHVGRNMLCVKNTGFAIQLPFGPLLKQMSETVLQGSTIWLN